MRKIKKVTIVTEDDETLEWEGYGALSEVRTTQRDEDHKETPVYYIAVQLTPVPK